MAVPGGLRKIPADLSSFETEMISMLFSLGIGMIPMLLVRGFTCTDSRSVLAWTFVLEQEEKAISKLTTVKSELFTNQLFSSVI